MQNNTILLIKLFFLLVNTINFVKIMFICYKTLFMLTSNGFIIIKWINKNFSNMINIDK